MVSDGGNEAWIGIYVGKPENPVKIERQMAEFEGFVLCEHRPGALWAPPKFETL